MDHLRNNIRKMDKEKLIFYLQEYAVNSLADINIKLFKEENI